MLNFSGQTALITGASGGIGEACARLFHQHGAKVIISGTKETKLQSLAADLKENVEIRVCNLADSTAAEELINNIEQLDILVCNAGITKDTLALRMSDEDFTSVLQVNLTSSFILNRGAIKKMMRARYGRIINIASVLALSGNPGQANYCASKAGLIGMSKSLALEVATRGVTVNCVAPGFIVTNMTDKLTDQQKDFIATKIPTHTFGSPEDIAHGVAYLASKEAQYITGQTLHINGGMLMV